MLGPMEAIAPTPDSLLSALNPPQREAVETTEGPVLVLSGAGTGKTRALTTRLAHILHQGKAWPSQILAVTFTNRASKEMRRRLEDLLGHPAEGLWLGTFHALSLRILRRHCELLDLAPSFTILDTDDQLRLLKQILEANDIDIKKTPPRMVASVINRWKDRALLPEKVPTGEHNTFVDIYEQYQNRLRILNAVDFGDLILLCIKLFQDHGDLLEKYQQQFHYILVDEYQDTNVAQYLWLRLLTQGHGNLCCVGDDDQSIYGWRGAEVGNILRFEKDFPGAKVIRLEQNYRSTSPILATASGLISHNKSRLGKELWTDMDQEADPVMIKGVWDGEAEARYVGEEIEARQRHGISLSEIAILVRASFQTREFEDRLLVLGVPYRVIGGQRFYERQEIRDAMAYLRLVVQPHDSLAFERIINVPRRGIGAATLQTLHQLSREKETSLPTAALELLQTDKLRGRAKNALATFFTELDTWRRLIPEEEPASLAGRILDEAEYTAMWQTDKSPDAPGRLENLKELIAAIGEFDTLQGFLEYVSLVTERQQEAGTEFVTIVTIHSAKGLEFDTVFLAGWEEGLLPHPRSLDDNGEAGLEEERRLAYVALTRAKNKAVISFAANRRRYGGWQSSLPSRFLEELPANSVARDVAPGLWDRGAPAQKREQTESVPVTTFFGDPHDDRPKNFRVNQKVFHQKFGPGKIISVEGDRLQVDFRHAGIKRVLSNFIEVSA
ncbi:MAG: UvrD-helicase domain-containing protein [bacterium]|nr:UvrD-helicase domain-containing protein [bacterium]